MVYPNIPSMKDSKGSAVNPSAGDNPSVEVNTGSSVVVFPEATNIAIVNGETKILPTGAAEKKIPQAGQVLRQAQKKNKWLLSTCVVLLFLSGAGIVTLSAMEVMKHTSLQESVNKMLPRMFMQQTTIETKDGYHTHKDLSGNKYRTTLASSDHCLHRREFMMSNGNNEVIHDTRSKWSVLIGKNLSSCFLFSTASRVRNCPVRYPWELDEVMGIIPAKIAMPNSPRKTRTRIVSRLYTSNAIPDISCAGRAIYDACKGYNSYEVLGTSMCYVEIEMSRPERAVASVLEAGKKMVERSLFEAEHHPELKVPTTVKVQRQTIDTEDVIIAEEFIGPMPKSTSETSGEMLYRILEDDDLKEELL